jgi:hypothetical protein
MRTPNDAKKAWDNGNNAGAGFAPGPWFTDRTTTVQDAIDDMLDEDGSRLRLDLSSDGIQVVEHADGRIVGVCGADGAWAVFLN